MHDSKSKITTDGKNTNLVYGIISMILNIFMTLCLISVYFRVIIDWFFNWGYVPDFILNYIYIFSFWFIHPFIINYFLEPILVFVLSIVSAIIARIGMKKSKSTSTESGLRLAKAGWNYAVILIVFVILWGVFAFFGFLTSFFVFG